MHAFIFLRYSYYPINSIIMSYELHSTSQEAAEGPRTYLGSPPVHREQAAASAFRRGYWSREAGGPGGPLIIQAERLSGQVRSGQVRLDKSAKHMFCQARSGQHLLVISYGVSEGMIVLWSGIGAGAASAAGDQDRDLLPHLALGQVRV